MRPTDRKPNTNIRAVLFDLDGVLVEARDWHYEALNKALGLFGFTITREEHDGYYNGLPTRKKLVRLTQDKKLPEALHDFISEMKQHYTFNYIYTDCIPDFSKQSMLKNLKARGLKLAVCSNAIKDSIVMMLQKADIIHYFDLILSNQDVKNNKPDPEIYLNAMDHFGLKPEECIIVEDAPHGREAAHRSGANVIEVSGADDVHLLIFKEYFPDIA